MNEVTSPRHLLSFQLWHVRKCLLSGLHISASVCEADRASLGPLPTQGCWGHICAHCTWYVLVSPHRRRHLEPDDFCPLKVHRRSPTTLFYFLLHSSVTVGSGSPSQLITWAIAALACKLFLSWPLFPLQMYFKLTFPSTVPFGSGGKEIAVATLT